MINNSILDRKKILEEASKTISQERVDKYGKPEDSFANIGEFWGVVLRSAGYDVPNIPAWVVSIMMVVFKISRSFGQKHTVDNFIDGSGYMAIAGELKCREVDRDNSTES